MAQLIPLLRDISGIYSDRARDRLPSGSVWELTDWIPVVQQAGARMRGAWHYQSDVLPAIPDGMIYAPYQAGSRLLVCDGTDLSSVQIATVGSASVGAISPTLQDPVFHRDRVIIPAANGTSPAKYVTLSGSTFALADAPSGGAPGTALTGKYACVWKDRLVLGGSAAFPTRVAYSPGGDPTGGIAPWDNNSQVDTSYSLTGLAAQRTQVLCFHESSVERIRGTLPPTSTGSNPLGDLVTDVLFDRAGCYDARSISTLSDNVLFCDERGIHLTDGSNVKNMAEQGGVLNLWHAAFERNGNPPLTIGGVVHRNYYIVTLRHSGLDPVTFVTDITTRRTFTLGNIDATCFGFSVGSTEGLWGADAKTRKVTDLTPVFSNEERTDLQIDGDGAPVLPVISTGWSELTRGSAFKRIHDVHFKYEADTTVGTDVFDVSYIKTPTSDNVLLSQLKSQPQFGRAKTFVRRRMPGLGVKLQQLVATKDSRLYSIEVRANPEEATRL